MPKDSEELQPWNHVALTVSNPKLNFLLCRMLLVEMETGRAGEAKGRGKRSLNLLTFTACCGIKPCGQDRTLTRLSRDDKLAVLPDAWLPDLYSLSGGGEKGGGGGDSVKWCQCRWGACTGNAHFTLSIRIPNEQDGNTIQSIFSNLDQLIEDIICFYINTLQKQCSNVTRRR